MTKQQSAGDPAAAARPVPGAAASAPVAPPAPAAAAGDGGDGGDGEQTVGPPPAQSEPERGGSSGLDAVEENRSGQAAGSVCPSGPSASGLRRPPSLQRRSAVIDEVRLCTRAAACSSCADHMSPMQNALVKC